MRGLFFLTALAVASSAWATDFSEARAKAAEYAANQKAFDTALVDKDSKELKRLDDVVKDTLKDARRLFEQAGIQDSDDIGAILEYVGLLRIAGDYDIAARTFEHAVKAAPNNAELWAGLAQSLAELGPTRRKEAFEAARKAVAIDANSAQAHYALGDLDRREGLYAFAREEFDAALKAAPDNVRMRIALDAARVRDGQMAEASADLDALGKAAQPYDAETRVLLRQAITDFEAQRRWFDDTAANHAAYAKLLYRAGRFADTVLAGQRATHLNPKDTATWNFMAMVYMQVGSSSKAREAYQRSLEANPDQPTVQEALSKLPEEKPAVAEK